MKAVFVIARQVVSEASRRRLLLALVLLTILVIALTVWGVSRIDDLRNAGQPLSDAQKKTIVSQLLILVMFMFSWVLSLAAVFVASPAISGELESGIALAILARPISRAEYVVGKWLGLAALVVAYGLAAGIVEIVAVQLVSGYQPPHPLEFLGFVLGEGLVILTFALMLSTRVAGMVGGVIAAESAPRSTTRPSRTSVRRQSSSFPRTDSGVAPCGASSLRSSSRRNNRPGLPWPRTRSSPPSRRPPRT